MLERRKSCFKLALCTGIQLTSCPSTHPLLAPTRPRARPLHGPRTVTRGRRHVRACYRSSRCTCLEQAQQGTRRPARTGTHTFAPRLQDDSLLFSGPALRTCLTRALQPDPQMKRNSRSRPCAWKANAAGATWGLGRQLHRENEQRQGAPQQDCALTLTFLSLQMQLSLTAVGTEGTLQVSQGG